MFTLRFDMRAPAWAAPIEDLYTAALDMSAWAETRGADTVRAGGILPLLPLCGGLAPDVAWPYLRRAADAVARANR